MSNHGTALSDDTIIRVDRSTSVVYPHYWWLKNVAHPEFQAKGPLSMTWQGSSCGSTKDRRVFAGSPAISSKARRKAVG
jgi:hypothetical protein